MKLGHRQQATLKRVRDREQVNSTASVQYEYPQKERSSQIAVFFLLYARTNGSLLLVMLLHAAVNNTKDIVPSATPGGTNTFGLHATQVAWLTVGLVWLCAVYFLIRMPRMLEAASTQPAAADR